MGGQPPEKKDNQKKKRGRPITDGEKKMQQSFESRNKAVEFTLFCKMSANLAQNLRELNSTKRKLVKQFTKHCNGDKRVAKTRIRLVRAQRKALNQNGDGDDSSNDSIDEYEDSQETTLMEICDVEESINMTKTDLDIVKQKKKDVSEALGK